MAQDFVLDFMASLTLVGRYLVRFIANDNIRIIIFVLYTFKKDQTSNILYKIH